MIKKVLLFGLALLAAGQLLMAQSFQIVTLSADGDETFYALSDVQKIVFENNTMTVKMKSGDDVTNITNISFALDLSGIDYSKLKINEVNGTGDNADMFYELINIGTEPINLQGCKIDYNANGSNNGVFPPNGNQGITWMGCAEHIIAPGEFFMIKDRNSSHVIDINSCVTVMRTGLTAQRILIITLFDPDGNVIDRCIRAKDSGDYAITNKSFSRIPDGTGPFYFTDPTPCETNGDATGLLLVPQSPDTGIGDIKVESSIFIYPNPVKEYFTVNGTKKDIRIILYDLSGRLLRTIPAQDNSTNINISNLQQGTYLMHVGDQIVKFVKQ